MLNRKYEACGPIHIKSYFFLDYESKEVMLKLIEASSNLE